LNSGLYKYISFFRIFGSLSKSVQLGIRSYNSAFVLLSASGHAIIEMKLIYLGLFYRKEIIQKYQNRLYEIDYNIFPVQKIY